MTMLVCVPASLAGWFAASCQRLLYHGRLPLFCRKWPLPKQSKSSWPLLQQQQLLFDCFEQLQKVIACYCNMVISHLFQQQQLVNGAVGGSQSFEMVTPNRFYTTERTRKTHHPYNNNSSNQFKEQQQQITAATATTIKQQ